LFFLARNTLRSKLFCSPPLMFWDKTFWLFLPEVFSLFFQLFARYSARKFFFIITAWILPPPIMTTIRARRIEWIFVRTNYPWYWCIAIKPWFTSVDFSFSPVLMLSFFFFYKNIYSLARGRIFLKPTPREYIFLNTTRECQALNNFYRNLP